MATDERVLQKELRLVVSDLVQQIDNGLGARKSGIDYLNKSLALKDGKLWWIIKRGYMVNVAKKRHINRSNSFTGIYRWETNEDLSLERLIDVRDQLIEIAKGY